MFPDLHATVLLGTIVGPLIVVAASPGWRARPLRDVLVALLPIVCVGVLLSLMASVMGFPIAEWVFPAAGIVVAGLFVKSRRTFETVRWSLFGLTVCLCLNSMFLRMEGYSSDVKSAGAMYRTLERGRLDSAGDALARVVPGNQVLPPEPLRNVLGQTPLTEWDRKSFERLWHTSFTGLYRIAATPGEVWYPGGPVATGSKQLEWRPTDS
jgi:hypothetical protein